MVEFQRDNNVRLISILMYSIERIHMKIFRIPVLRIYLACILSLLLVGLYASFLAGGEDRKPTTNGRSREYWEKLVEMEKTFFQNNRDL